MTVCIGLIEGTLEGHQITSKCIPQKAQHWVCLCIRIKIICCHCILVYAASKDFVMIRDIQLFPVGSWPGDQVCFDIDIINDIITEGSEYFTVHVEVLDINTVVPMAYSYALIHIIDEECEYQAIIQLKT